MSPSVRGREDGIPCTMTSLGEAQRDFGYPRYPLKAGVAPAFVVHSSALRSRSRVVTPGLTISLSRIRTSSTILLHRSIVWISDHVLQKIMTPGLSRSPRKPASERPRPAPIHPPHGA